MLRACFIHWLEYRIDGEIIGKLPSIQSMTMATDHTSKNALDERLQKLEDKYRRIGQDLHSYLDGLLYSNPLHYWEYIKVDTLLSLQEPRTDFPDEHVFIMYHQITELYFKLALLEYEQIANNGKRMSESGEDLGWNDSLDAEFFLARVRRINGYFTALTSSFGIMIDGMEPEQFLKFRMSLLPASGFQSAQYRLIEMASTDLSHLVFHELRGNMAHATVEEKVENLYWKRGAIIAETGEKTLTLKNFEKKYTKTFVDWAREYEHKNLWYKYHQLSAADREREDLRTALRELDTHVNVNWPLVHYKSAVRYLASKSGDAAATGGTNWQKYLPPRFQKRIFFPELWSDLEKEEWGKAWVEMALK